jgi:hippurate hydrolase
MSNRTKTLARCGLVGLIVLGFLATLATARPVPPAETAALTGAKLKDLAAAVKEKVGTEIGSLDTLYKTIHASPELSYKEERTAGRLAKEMKGLGFDVTEKVGGYGIVCVLKNGPGPTILVRTDMDALPVTENTGLPYASKIRTRDKSDLEVGVMHACGHDMHMTCWVGTARVLASMKDRWSGTLVFIGQPAEEVGAGAKMMLGDGLYTKFPRPDYALALHCDTLRPINTIGFTEGLAMANVDTVDITVRGKGGHGAAPHTTVDPVVLAARIILDMQTLVSRETNPLDPAVVTVGSIHGGSKHNIIPAEVKLQLTVRSTKDSVRKNLLEGIERVAKAAAAGARAPEPIVTVNQAEFTPALMNDTALTRRTVGMFREVLGEKNVEPRPTIMGGEDFSRYSQGGIPIFLFWLGTIDEKRWKESQAENGKPLPSAHSEFFYPDPDPTIRTGVLSMSLAVLNLCAK